MEEQDGKETTDAQTEEAKWTDLSFKGSKAVRDYRLHGLLVLGRSVDCRNKALILRVARVDCVDMLLVTLECGVELQLGSAS